MDKDALDEALRKERESRMSKGDAMSAKTATMDLELYGSGGQEYSSTIVEEEASESSSSASARAASLAQRVIASHTRGMEGEDADGDEALKRFREAGGTLNTSKIADRDDSVRLTLLCVPCVCARALCLYAPAPLALPPLTPSPPTPHHKLPFFFHSPTALAVQTCAQAKHDPLP